MFTADSRESYGVVNDLALLIGDVLIERCPNLWWVFYDSGARKHAKFQRHVFSHRVIADLPVDENAFAAWVRSTEENA